MTTLNEIFKSSFIENMTEISFVDISLSLTASLIVGMLIYFVYKKTFSGVMYSKPFHTSLVLMTLVTTFVILAVTSNVVLSLGMVGALSIVRFRTAIKDPLDLVFLFWSIGSGIILGAGLFPLAFIGSLVIGMVLLAFQNVNIINDSPYILMINLTKENAELKVENLLSSKLNKKKLKSKIITQGEVELVYELRLKDNHTAFINEIYTIDGIKNASLISYNGEYAG